MYENQKIPDWNDPAILRSMRKLDDFYAGKKTLSMTVLWDGCDGCFQVDQVTDNEKKYQAVINNLNRQLEYAKEGYDNVPVASFCGDIAYIYALAYGCDMHFQGNLVVSKPMYEDIEDTEGFVHLEKPWEKGVYPIIFSQIEEFQRRYGDAWISVSDTQSPIDVFNLLFSTENAIYALYDDPDQSHKILDSITKTIININRHFEEKCNKFAGFSAEKYLPRGLHLSDDDAAYLSPDVYKEFASPYDERLSEEFGGVNFHVCLKYEQNLENLIGTKGFIGCDAMPDYNDNDRILRNLAQHDHPVWHVYNYGWTRNAESPLSDIDYFKLHIDQAAENGISLDLGFYMPEKGDCLRLAEQVREYALSKGFVY